MSLVRALQGDLVPGYQQHLVQSASVVMVSFGDLAVNGVLHLFEEPIKHIRMIFLIAAMFYTATTMSLLIYGSEQKNVAFTKSSQILSHGTEDSENARTEDSDDSTSSLDVLGYLRSLPPKLWRIGGTYALGYFTFYCILPYASSWLGSSVLRGMFFFWCFFIFKSLCMICGISLRHGANFSHFVVYVGLCETGRADAPSDSKEARLYEKGVNLYGEAGIIRGIAQILFSAFYPKVLELGVSPGQLMCLSFISFACVTIIFANTHNSLIAQLAVILFSLPNACLMTVPVGLTAKMSNESNRGRYLGALNIFAVIPQLIDTA